MFTHAALQAKIFTTFVLAEALLVVLSAPIWRDFVNPFGLF
jgi:hypothetical protein